MSFKEISHTADVKIQARAPTLESLFSETCNALMQVMYGTSRKGLNKREIVVTSDDTESLLLEFLSEVLFVSEVEGIVFSAARVRINGSNLQAEMEGEPFNKDRHAQGTEVKGISYSGLSIRQDANGYMVDILFDV
ncbi:MAG: archease [Methanoregula sp.]|nr:archease [Methanoregula sp.]